MFEVEKRGYLEGKEKEKFLDFLNKNATLKKKSNQLAIFAERNGAFLGTFDNTKVGISIALIKNLSENKSTGVLKAKFGQYEASSRKELNIPFDPKNIQQIFDFLGIFGITRGCPRFYKRVDYEYEGYEISIKEDGLMADHFEIEKQVENENDIEMASEKMEDLISKFGLKFLEEKEYKEIIRKIYEENPAVPIEEIDLTNFGLS